ncbi:MAG: hypothetical protein H3Z52_06395 [archaeon]|nr:hypothetical protein [archaeon]MCP8320553.1 hypothetical protein [archaeon]
MAVDKEKKKALGIVGAKVLREMRAYFDNEGFLEVVVPHITAGLGACENIDTMFELNKHYFGKPTYLSQTGQLFLEELVPVFGKVWCQGPSFRAETSVYERHLSEFWLVEFEFTGSFDQLLTYIEELLKQVVANVTKSARSEFLSLGIDLERLNSLRRPFPRIRYEEAIKILNKDWGGDLTSEDEKRLVNLNRNTPIFVTHHPIEMKFFNMKNNESDPRVVNSADLILPYSGEAVGAAEREYRFDILYQKLLNSRMFQQLQAKGTKLEAFDRYFDSIKERGVPHAGGGIGLNRIIQYLLGEQDIRRATMFPINKESLL